MINAYPLLRPFLFLLTPHVAHRLTMTMLRITPQCLLPRIPDKPCNVMGLQFKNPIGLSAGIDSNGDYIDELGRLGVGFIEVGGVSPRPQAGNPLPRIFRLKAQQSIINRNGFPNKGVDYLVENLKRRRYSGIVGVNITKGRETPNEQAFADYQTCYLKVYDVADYVTLNISSPNTPGLRELQSKQYLQDLLTKMKALQQQQFESTQRYVPLTVKLSPDLSNEELSQMVATIIATEIDGIIATNTSLSRDTVRDSELASQSGGLSGEGLRELSQTFLKQLNHLVAGRVPIISVGGINSRKEAQKRFELGASLCQVYTGLIYQGPKLLTDLL